MLGIRWILTCSPDTRGGRGATTVDALVPFSKQPVHSLPAAVEHRAFDLVGISAPVFCLGCRRELTSMFYLTFIYVRALKTVVGSFL